MCLIPLSGEQIHRSFCPARAVVLRSRSAATIRPRFSSDEPKRAGIAHFASSKRDRGFESTPLRHRVSGLRQSPGSCANCARVVAMRTAHRHRRAPNMASRAASLQLSLCGQVIRCRCLLLANATLGQEPPILARWRATSSFWWEEPWPEHRLLKRRHASSQPEARKYECFATRRSERLSASAMRAEARYVG